MSLKLYLDLTTQPSRALYMFFRCADIPYEDVWVALRKKEQKKPAYLAIHPRGKIPVLVDESGGERLIVKESCTIARYVASKFLPPSNPWWPSDDLRKSLLIDEFLHWQHLDLRVNGTLVCVNALLKPLETREPPNIREVHRFLVKLGGSLDVFENYYLDKGRFIAGDKVSVADLFAVAEINQLLMVGFDVGAERPRLATWIEDVRNATQPHFDESAHVIRRMNNLFAEGIQEAYREFLEGEFGGAVEN